MEIPGGFLSSADQKDSVVHFGLVAIEEFLEMAGATVAIDALIGNLIARNDRLVIRFMQSQARAEDGPQRDQSDGS